MKIKLYFYYEQWATDTAGKIAAWHIKVPEEFVPEEFGARLRLFICEHEVEVPDVSLPPEIEVKRIMITGLRQQAKELQAETHMKLQAIEEKINQLQSLTYAPEPK